MNDTQAVGYTDEVLQNKAYSYRPMGETYINLPVKLSTMGSSGVYSSINDMSIWAKNYQKVVLGQKKFFKKMEMATYLNSGKQIKYGLGLQYANYKGLDIVFHGGGTESYRSYILHAPKQQLSMIFLSNIGDFSGLDILYKSLEFILSEFIEQISISETNWNNGMLKAFDGTYEIFPGTYYTFMSEGGELYFQEFGSSEKAVLPRIDQNIFCFPFIPHSKFEFYNDSLDFHLADFTYPAKKVNINLPKTERLKLEKFIGIYKNTEYNTTYELILVDDKLTAVHGTINNPIVLYPIAKNSFYSNQSFFGKIDFIENSEKSLTGFKLSGQNLKNIFFKKIF
ncbi:MAG: serine hydrolase domain-containing protein [Maribacter litoralis]|uniref:serine hydrolase domain-containing protein n=1 Tax=Maribacter litoralis TaxID=2059726 RepID=UPI0032997FBC